MRGYVYVKASGKCECPKSQKKFVEADKNGKAMWVCVIDSDNMLPLLAHESSKHIDKVTSRDCISARLQLKRDAAQVTCRCKVKNLGYGGSGQDLLRSGHQDGASCVPGAAEAEAVPRAGH